MTSVIDSPTSVRSGDELPIEPLASYLNSLFGRVADLSVKQYRGGHSNLTYLLTHGDKEMILRRPPVGSKVATAHDMSREFKVLSALSGSFGKAPEPILFCEDEEVIGAPFYLMERLSGIVLRRKPPPDLTLDPATCGKLCEHLVDALAELHSLPFAELGLGELGRPDGYVERQVGGWTKRYQKAKTSELAEADRVAAWLAENQPSSSRASLIHNDFKFDNLILKPETFEVAGILDWEMSTVGDPLMDLGTSLSYWIEASDPPDMRALAFAPTELPGMWSRAEIIARYEQRTGTRVKGPLFYYVFGLFKLAVIVQQIYFRYAKGLTSDKRFAGLGRAAEVLLSHADRCIIDSPFE